MLPTLARWIAAALLIASAAVFATGAAIEHHTASGETQPTYQHTESHAGDENPARAEGAARHEGHEGSAVHAAEQNSEDLLGINPEATGLVVTAVLVSLGLAVLILTVRSSLVAVGVALAMLAFTALDIRELAHQLHESRPGLAALAATVAMLHLLAAAAALVTARSTHSQPGGASTA